MVFLSFLFWLFPTFYKTLCKGSLTSRLPYSRLAYQYWTQDSEAFDLLIV